MCVRVCVCATDANLQKGRGEEIEEGGGGGVKF